MNYSNKSGIIEARATILSNKIKVAFLTGATSIQMNDTTILMDTEFSNEELKDMVDILVKDNPGYKLSPEVENLFDTVGRRVVDASECDYISLIVNHELKEIQFFLTWEVGKVEHIFDVSKTVLVVDGVDISLKHTPFEEDEESLGVVMVYNHRENNYILIKLTEENKELLNKVEDLNLVTSTRCMMCFNEVLEENKDDISILNITKSEFNDILDSLSKLH